MLKLWRPLDTGLAAGMINNDLSVDVLDEKDNVIVEVHLAGIDPEKIDVSVELNHLRISAQREESSEMKEGNYFRKEIIRGYFQRVVELPAVVDPSKTMAEAKHGLLRIVMPKMKTDKASKIKITKK